MIYIDQKKLVGSGGFRLVYLHPDDNKKIIKICRTPLIQKRHVKRWHVLFGIPDLIDLNMLELREHAKARKRGKDVARHICRAHEIVDTNMGPGLTLDLVCDDTGKPSISIEKYVVQHKIHNILNKITDLFSLLQRNHILFSDTNCNNILVRVRGNDKRLVIVDGLGEQNINPLPVISRAINARRLRHRLQRLLSALEPASTR